MKRTGIFLSCLVGLGILLYAVSFSALTGIKRESRTAAAESGASVTGDAAEIIIGDVSKGGKVDITDAVMILEYVLTIRDFDQQQLLAADVDGNGSINVSDVIYVLRYINGIIDSFPMVSALFTFSDASDLQMFEPIFGAPWTRELDPSGDYAYLLEEGLVSIPNTNVAGGGFRYALLQYDEVNDFTFETEVLGNDDNSTQAVIFGWEDPANYHYVYLSERAHTRIGRVIDSEDNRLYDPRIEEMWMGDSQNYQHIKVQVTTEGFFKQVKVFINRLEDPLMEYSFHASQYTPGRIGLGTWNSSSQSSFYKNIRLTGLAQQMGEYCWEAKADAIIATGMDFLGTPYVFGASSDRTDIFDCSSFVQRIHGMHGIGLPRNSRSQYQASVGTLLPGSNLEGADLNQMIDDGIIRRGDLLFTTNSTRQDNTGIERVGHVVIYLGDNHILHAARPEVKVDPISSLFISRFLGARRVIPE